MVFVVLGTDKTECVQEKEGGDSSAASFIASVGEKVLVRGIVSCMPKD